MEVSNIKYQISKILKLFLVLCTIALYVQYSFAEEDDRFDLGEIVVTPTKSTQFLKDCPVPTTVLDSRYIDSIEEAKDVGDLIKTVSSAKVSRYGGIGQASDISLRGLRSVHTLVLVDGRSINPPALGGADLSWILADDIDRIEIVRGANSSLYGSDAIAGVVNIITKPIPDKITPKVSISYGTWDTVTTNLSIAGPIKTVWDIVRPAFCFGGNLIRTNGARDNSSHTAKRLYGKFTLDIKDAKFKLQGDYYKDNTRHPGPRPAENSTLWTLTQRVFGNDEVSSLNDWGKDRRWSLNGEFEFKGFRIKSFYNNWNDDNFQEYISLRQRHREVTNNRTRFYGVEPQYSCEIFANLVTLGFSFKKDDYRSELVDYNLDRGGSPVTHQTGQRTTKAIFFQDEINLDPLTLNLGVRWDKLSDFKSQVSPKASLLYKFDRDTNLRFSYGKSFRAPSLTDLYWPATAMGQGNPGLKPEKGRSYEVGLERIFGKMILARVTVFYQKVKNMVTWAPTGPAGPFGNIWQPSNVNSVKTTGAEAEMKLSLTRDFNISFNYTYLNAIQRNAEVVDAITNRMEFVKRFAIFTPKHKYNLEVELRQLFKIKGLRLNLNMEYYDKIFNYYTNWNMVPVTMDIKKIGSYLKTDIRVAKEFGKEKEIFLAVDNLFDKRYATKFGSNINDRDYPMPGRSITGGVKARF